jgi:soluble lytic murein transglycosylase-like protein
MLAALACLACSGTAHAGDVYRYKDPFGRWHTMFVAKGLGKYYRRAQLQACARAGAPASCTAPQVAGGAGVASLLRLTALGPPGSAADYQKVIQQAASDSGVEGALLTAVIAVESGFRKDARSPKGALGLMQLMPSTAATLLDVEDVQTALIDPATNIWAGSRHLRRLLDQYPGRLDLALAAYNAGEGAVNKYEGIPPYAETQQYVREVLALYGRYKVAGQGPAHGLKEASR